MIDLHEDVVSMFAGLVVFVATKSGFTFFRRENPEDVVARVARWRIANRERRNATARAKNAEERAERAAYARAWRARRKAT